MSLRLKKGHFVTPPDGWRDILPTANGNGIPFVADHFDALVEKEVKFMRSNAIAVPDNFPEQVEDRICHRIPNGLCADTTGREWHGGFKAQSTENISNNTIVLKLQRGFVAHSEACRRVAICQGCSLCQNYKGGCASCKGVKSTIDNMLTNRRVLVPDPLYKICDALGVFIKVLVHLDMSANLPANVDSISEGCWLKKESSENG